MTERLSRGAEYILVPNRKPKKPVQYVYETDDDNESQIATVTRKVVRQKPAHEQHIRYITADELERDHRRQRVVETNDRKIKVRNTANGEPVILDEDDNVIKIVRNVQTPTPPPVAYENRRVKHRSHEPLRTVYYETPDGRLIAQPANIHSFSKPKTELIYTDRDPTKLLRKVIIDPRTGEQETIFEDSPKKHHRKKYVVRKQINNESPVESDGDDEQQSQYVQVVQRQTAPTQVVTKPEKPGTKYVMVRKKVDSEPIYAVPPLSRPAVNSHRRIVYETATSRKPATTYVYSADDKYYK
ncbi:unnamed protein product [Adineta ricciae]|uniref:Uncharacterized protein n=1 Tax=Adineta ricciae TaxID=249248 RepID=A0A815DYW3_ADIRI|nr:unnamed protein product [Adineta ricciae]CAF1304107.1 unnamed protein product [Adineta ricciae]